MKSIYKVKIIKYKTYDDLVGKLNKFYDNGYEMIAMLSDGFVQEAKSDSRIIKCLLKYYMRCD